MISFVKYLLDANVLIEAKNRYYSYEIAPGFWKWLEWAIDRKLVYSIGKVQKELKNGNDELADWAAKQKDRFFIEPSDSAIACAKLVNQWANNNYAAAHYDKFAKGADPLLIAQAHVEGHYLVTVESAAPSRRNKIKIPIVCDKCEHVNVKYIATWDMLEREQVKLVQT